MSIAGTMPEAKLAPNLYPRTLGELRAFVGLAEKQPVDLSIPIGGLARSISELSDKLALSAINKRTSEEFTREAALVFNDYASMLRAKADLVSVVFRGNSQDIETVVAQSISRLEAEFRDH